MISKSLIDVMVIANVADFLKSQTPPLTRVSARNVTHFKSSVTRQEIPLMTGDITLKLFVSSKGIPPRLI